MNVNEYLVKVYGPKGCWKLVKDVYEHELGRTVTDFRTINSSVRALISAFEIAVAKNPDGFAQLDAPEEMCVVLLGKSAAQKVHHAGVYVDGKVLHVLETGNVYQDMSSLRDTYQTIEYWGLPS